MGASITCTWDEFKRMAKEFHDAAPTLDLDQLDNAWKCLSLAYLGMTDRTWFRSAEVLLQMEARTFFERERELLR